MVKKTYPHVSATGKRFRKDTLQGRAVHIYENKQGTDGAILDASSGEIAAPIPGTVITPQTAGSMANTRWEKARAEFERGAVEAVNGSSPADVQRALAKALTKRAIQPFSTDAVSAAKEVSRLAQWTPSPDAKGKVTSPEGFSFEGNPEVLRELLQMARQEWRRREALRAEQPAPVSDE